MRPLLILAFLATSLAGCSTTKRSVTHINWYQEEAGSSAYIASWDLQVRELSSATVHSLMCESPRPQP
jgi:hypothetical protein